MRQRHAQLDFLDAAHEPEGERAALAAENERPAPAHGAGETRVGVLAAAGKTPRNGRR